MDALILFYVLIHVWSAFFQVSWLLRHPDQMFNCLTSQPNTLGQPSVGIAVLLQIAAGLPLFFICSKMAKREKKMLNWFFLLWPILFLSECYVAIINEQGRVHIETIVIGTILFTLLDFSIIAYYLQRSSKVLFEERNSSIANLA